MFDWFNTMSTFEQLTTFAAAISGITGAVWWMSKMFFTVNAIQTNTRNTNTKLDTLTDRVDGDMREIRHDVSNLKERVGKVEGIIEAEFGAE